MSTSTLPSPTVKTVFRIALPLIISGLAANSTIFADRIILSWHNTDMMTHVTTSSNFSWLFLFSMSSIAYVSKIYVGQYNGAKEYKMAGHITWQLLFFAILSTILFIFAYFAAPMIIPDVVHTYGLDYFRILMLGGIMWPISSAITGFLIGTYQTYVVLSVLLIANTTNIVLDLAWIPDHGTIGAAWATISAMSLQSVLLIWMFLSPDNQKKFNTHCIKLDIPLMIRALRLGYPEAASHFFEMAAWASIISIMANTGPEFLLISSIAQNLFILFMFTYCELGNAVKTLAANYVGANRVQEIGLLLTSSLKIHATFVLMLATLSVLHPEWVIDSFGLGEHTVNVQQQVILAMSGLTVFFLLDGIAYILMNILAAFGDTFMSMVISSTNMWAFLVAPTYLAAQYLPITPTTLPLVILPFYGIVICSSLYWRYRGAPVTLLTDQC